MVYDIIGDVHGGMEPLRKLFQKLGYQRRPGGWYPPPGHQAVFLGDLVDRGRDVRATVRFVRRMVDAGVAQTIVGNHEWLLARYMTRNTQGKPRLEHRPMVYNVLENTFRDYVAASGQLMDDLAWLRRQPLYLDLPGFRVAHACWHQPDIERLKRCCPENCLSDQLLETLDRWAPELYDALERLLVGPKWPLPEGWAQPHRHHFRPQFLRYRWWLDPATTPLNQLDTMHLNLPHVILPASQRPTDYRYPPDEKPLFIGHYCLTGKPQRLQPNLAGVDYCVVRCGRQTAYRFYGESPLNQMHFIQGAEGLV